MRRTTLVASVLTLCIAPTLFAAAAAPAAPAAPAATAAPTTPPAGRGPGGPGGPGGRGQGRGPTSATQPYRNPGNNARHNDFLQIARLGGRNIDVLFVGDSITDGWSGAGRETFDRDYAPLKTANFGIGGDTTQGVLWRMQNGELDGFKAKAIVLLLGTNNINAATPNEQIAEGDRLIIEEFKKHQPTAKILVLGIFPRAVSPTDPYREKIKAINTTLASFADNKQVFYLDIGDKFLTPDGTLTPDIMPDALHPNAKGYEIWTAAMLPKLQELLK